MQRKATILRYADWKDERAAYLELPVGERAVHPFLQKLEIAEHDVDRRFELVRGDRDELRLELVELREAIGHRREARGQPPELVVPAGCDR